MFNYDMLYDYSSHKIVRKMGNILKYVLNIFSKCSWKHVLFLIGMAVGINIHPNGWFMKYKAIKNFQVRGTHCI